MHLVLARPGAVAERPAFLGGARTSKRPFSRRPAAPTGSGGPAIALLGSYGLSDARRTRVSMYPEEVQEVLYASGAVACLRFKQRTEDANENLALLAARAAIEGGLNVLEVTMDSPGASQVIHELRREFPDCIIGAGTVLSPAQVDGAVAAGAHLLMSPVLDKAVMRRAQHHGVLFVPGVMTPSEAVRAASMGAECVKLFPAGEEGLGLVRAMRGPLPNVGVIPSHGITLDLADRYLEAGAPAVVLSGAVFDLGEVGSGDAGAVRARARAAAARIREAKERLGGKVRGVESSQEVQAPDHLFQ